MTGLLIYRLIRARAVIEPENPSQPVTGVTAAASVAQARELKCYQDRATDAVHCVDVQEVTQRGTLRVAPLYRGGVDQVRQTSARLAVDCASRVAHLKDADGVSYGAGPINATPMLAELAGYVCAAKIRTR